MAYDIIPTIFIRVDHTSIYICNFFNFENFLSKLYEKLLVLYTLELTQENGAISICRLLLGNAKNKFFKGK